MSRPRPYTIAAILVVLYSLVDIAVNLPSLAQGAPAPGVTDAPPFFLLLFGFALDIIGIVGAYGVWRLQKWGVMLTIAVAALDCLTQLPGIIFAPGPLKVVSGLAFIAAAAVLVLLLRRGRTMAAV